MQFFMRAQENLLQDPFRNAAEGSVQGFMLGGILAAIRSEFVNTLETPGTQLLLITVPVLLGAVLGLINSCHNPELNNVPIP